MTRIKDEKKYIQMVQSSNEKNQSVSDDLASLRNQVHEKSNKKPKKQPSNTKFIFKANKIIQDYEDKKDETKDSVN